MKKTVTPGKINQVVKAPKTPTLKGDSVGKVHSASMKPQLYKASSGKK